MKSFQLSKQIHLVLICLMISACTSQVNHARSLVNAKCSDLGIPDTIRARKEEVILFEGKNYVPLARYTHSISYSKKLAGCITAFECSQKQSDRLHECDKQRSFVKEFVFGKSHCRLPEVEC